MIGHLKEPYEPVDAAELVLTLARDLLDRADIELDDDFFTAGGDSTVAVYLVGHLARRVGLPLRVSLLFANPQLREFGSQVQAMVDQATATNTKVQPPLTAALRAKRAGDGNSQHAS